MKNLENLAVIRLENKEIIEFNGGWADSTNDGMLGEGLPWTSGTEKKERSLFVRLVELYVSAKTGYDM